MYIFAHDFLGCILERLKSGDQDVCEQEQAFGTWVMLIEAPENLLGQNLTQDSTAKVNCLMMSGNRLFVKKLSSVDKKAVD